MANKRLRSIISIILTISMLFDFDWSKVLTLQQYTKAGYEEPSPTAVVETATEAPVVLPTDVLTV